MTLSQAMQALRAQRPQPTGPIGGVYDPRFKYRPSYATEVRETIDRAFNALAQSPAH